MGASKIYATNTYMKYYGRAKIKYVFGKNFAFQVILLISL